MQRRVLHPHMHLQLWIHICISGTEHVHSEKNAAVSNYTKKAVAVPAALRAVQVVQHRLLLCAPPRRLFPLPWW